MVWRRRAQHTQAQTHARMQHRARYGCRRCQCVRVRGDFAAIEDDEKEILKKKKEKINAYVDVSVCVRVNNMRETYIYIRRIHWASAKLYNLFVHFIRCRTHSRHFVQFLTVWRFSCLLHVRECVCAICVHANNTYYSATHNVDQMKRRTIRFCARPLETEIFE